jgi:hypothetical protein
MDVDNWLREIEKKLELTELTDEECVTVAAQQLIGTASAWWDSYCDSLPDPLRNGWNEFVEAFKDHHIPKAVMDRKADKFRHLKMGGDRAGVRQPLPGTDEVRARQYQH